jgi:hypothetical protein
LNLRGRDVIKPKDVPSKPKDVYTDLLSPRDCETVTRISSDIQEKHLKTAADYGFENQIGEDHLKIGGNYGVVYYGIGKEIGKDKDFMPKIAVSIVQIVDAQARENAIKEKLSGPSYAYSSVLKSWWPILLGLGIGIRLTRTHYDATTEKQKEKEKARKDVKTEST